MAEVGFWNRFKSEIPSLYTMMLWSVAGDGWIYQRVRRERERCAAGLQLTTVAWLGWVGFVARVRGLARVPVIIGVLCCLQVGIDLLANFKGRSCVQGECTYQDLGCIFKSYFQHVKWAFLVARASTLKICNGAHPTLCPWLSHKPISAVTMILQP